LPIFQPPQSISNFSVLKSMEELLWPRRKQNVKEQRSKFFLDFIRFIIVETAQYLSKLSTFQFNFSNIEKKFWLSFWQSRV
jgi:hypothetical protein